jgi:hypothetical protein
VGATVTMLAGPAAAAVPVPEAGPPLGQRGAKLHHPQAGVGFDLAPYGYREEERMVSGTARTVEGDAPAPYTTRVILRRPVDPARFNGTVLIEWFNVSVNHDIDVTWTATFEEILREGYAYMAVSAQPGRRALPYFDPVRYEDFDHPGDEYADDIFQQVGRLLESRRGGAALLGRPAEVLIATGQSQSAERLHVYTKKTQDESRVFDGFFIDRGREANGTIPFEAFPSVPTIFGLTENEAQPDQGNYGPMARVWQIAGSSHVDNWGDTYAIRNLQRDTSGQQPPPWDPEKEGGWGEMGEGTGQCGLVTGAPGANQLPQRYAKAAALFQLNRWIRTGRPAGRHPLFGFEDVDTLRPPMLRDADGNTVGGLRLPQIEVPVAAYHGRCPDTLQGYTRSFDDADLFSRYPTSGDYRAKMVAATRRALAAEIVRPCDAVDIYRRVERAAARWPVAARSPAAANPFSCPASADVIRLPSRRRCSPRRALRIGLRAPSGVAIRSATVRVTGRRSRTYRRRDLGARPIVLRRLPAGRIRLRVRAVVSDGRTFSAARRYPACAPRRR